MTKYIGLYKCRIHPLQIYRWSRSIFHSQNSSLSLRLITKLVLLKSSRHGNKYRQRCNHVFPPSYLNREKIESVQNVLPTLKGITNRWWWWAHSEKRKIILDQLQKILNYVYFTLFSNRENGSVNGRSSKLQSLTFQRGCGNDRQLSHIGKCQKRTQGYLEITRLSEA